MSLAPQAEKCSPKRVSLSRPKSSKADKGVHPGAGPHVRRPAPNYVDLQRYPLTQEPEAPAVSVGRRNGVDLLTHPVERLVVKAALVDTAAVPVDGGRTTVVVSMVAARRGAGTIASPRVCTRCSQTDSEHSGYTYPGCKCRRG